MASAPYPPPGATITDAPGGSRPSARNSVSVGRSMSSVPSAPGAPFSHSGIVCGSALTIGRGAAGGCARATEAVNANTHAIDTRLLRLLITATSTVVDGCSLQLSAISSQLSADHTAKP